jgi:hypothetical protein
MIFESLEFKNNFPKAQAACFVLQAVFYLLSLKYNHQEK